MSILGILQHIGTVNVKMDFKSSKAGSKCQIMLEVRIVVEGKNAMGHIRSLSSKCALLALVR